MKTQSDQTKLLLQRPVNISNRQLEPLCQLDTVHRYMSTTGVEFKFDPKPRVHDLHFPVIFSEGGECWGGSKNTTKYLDSSASKTRNFLVAAAYSLPNGRAESSPTRTPCAAARTEVDAALMYFPRTSLNRSCSASKTF